MIDILPGLIPILLADIVNPVLFGFMVYAAGTQPSVKNSLAALLGHTTAYFSLGLVIAPLLEKMSHRLENPFQIDYIISLVIGLLLIWVAVSLVRGKKTPETEEYQGLSPLKSFGIGAVINFIGIPFALPYFAVLGQILKANLSIPESVLILTAYNLLYALPFLIIPLLARVMGDRSRVILTTINNWIDKLSNFLMPIILGLVGIALVLDTIVFFITGKGLI